MTDEDQQAGLLKVRTGSVVDKRLKPIRDAQDDFVSFDAEGEPIAVMTACHHESPNATASHSIEDVRCTRRDAFKTSRVIVIL